MIALVHVATIANRYTRRMWPGPPTLRALCNQTERYDPQPGEPITCPECRRRVEWLVEAMAAEAARAAAKETGR